MSQGLGYVLLAVGGAWKEAGFGSTYSLSIEDLYRVKGSDIIIGRMI